MNIHEIYTAMSRAKKISQVHLNYYGGTFREAKESSNIIRLNVYTPKQGVIYKMSNDTKYYIGECELKRCEERKNEHIADKSEINLDWKFEILYTVNY